VEIWSAFILGVVGSLHCAGMCGPLVLALPFTGRNYWASVRSRLIYNFGRIITYAALGAALGLLGRTFALAGLQRWISMATGGLILLGCVGYTRFGSSSQVVRLVNWLKARFAKLLKQPTLASQCLMGMLNGLLPCGLVYTAGLLAMSGATVLTGVVAMLAFGVGTVPMMLAIGALGGRFQIALRFRFQKLIPLCLLVLGTLLMVRGMALGIPYLSPELSGRCSLCH
jgi:sulfite exporter TauE/SafE